MNYSLNDHLCRPVGTLMWNLDGIEQLEQHKEGGNINNNVRIISLESKYVPFAFQNTSALLMVQYCFPISI